MPPQPAKNISSYFNKLPTPTKPPNTSSIPTSVTAATSSSPIKVVPSSPLTSNPASSPATTSTSQKRGFLSDAARKAIAEGVSEGNAAKKVKLDDGTATTAPSESTKLTMDGEMVWTDTGEKKSQMSSSKQHRDHLHLQYPLCPEQARVKSSRRNWQIMPKGKVYSIWRWIRWGRIGYWLYRMS